MNRFSILGMSFCLMIGGANSALTYSDHPEEKPPLQTPAEELLEKDNEYGKEDESGNNIYSIGGDGDMVDADMGLSVTELNGNTIGSSDNNGMQHGGESDHAGHQMPEIKISKHEWNGSSKKGYWAAIGLTLFAGAAFGMLVLVQPRK